MSLFPLGRTVATLGALRLLDHHDLGPLTLLDRHRTGDWGELDPEDVQANNDAVENGDRLLSRYLVFGEAVWIITEADRSVTTILLPSEY